MDDKTMNKLAEIFRLHPLTLEDCTVVDTGEKIENRNICKVERGKERERERERKR
jgi:Mg2+ and Co2+ transporter CorA